jgi:PST family polysaccharide transporter
MERMKYITYLNILSKFIFTIAIFAFVHKQEDYLFVPALTALGFIVAGVWSLTLIKKDFGVKFELVPFSIAKDYFIDSSQYFLSRVSVSIYTSSIAFVLGLFTNNTVVGYYAMAEKLYQALQGLYLPLVNAIYPFIAKERNIALFKKIFYFAVFGNSILISFLFLASGQILRIVFGLDAGIMTENVFRVLLVAALIVVPSILLGYPFLGALGKARHANLSVVYGSVFHLIFLSLLVLTNHVEGFTVAVAVLFTESIVFSYRLYFAKELGLWAKQS